MKKYLVMSLGFFRGGFEPQWYLDYIVAESPEKAEEEVRFRRMGLAGANAIELDGMKNVVLELAMTTPEQIALDWASKFGRDGTIRSGK